MSVQTGISCRARQTFVISERNMLIRPWILVALGKPVVYDVYVMLSLTDADQIVVRLDITVEEASRMDVLYPLD